MTAIASAPTTTEFRVRGMSCSHCERAVTEQISRVPGVVDVRVDLTGGFVAVTGIQPPDSAALAAAVADAGYEVAS